MDDRPDCRPAHQPRRPRLACRFLRPMRRRRTCRRDCLLHGARQSSRRLRGSFPEWKSRVHRHRLRRLELQPMRRRRNEPAGIIRKPSTATSPKCSSTAGDPRASSTANSNGTSPTRPAPAWAYYDRRNHCRRPDRPGPSASNFHDPDRRSRVINVADGSADALFLRNRLRDYVSRPRWPTSARRSLTVKCELLFPYDVNYPTQQLNRYRESARRMATAAVERLRYPQSGGALAFTASTTCEISTWPARPSASSPPSAGRWPPLRYLVPVFGIADPWERELALVWGAGLPLANLWALDHVCLFNLRVPERPLERRSLVKTK